MQYVHHECLRLWESIILSGASDPKAQLIQPDGQPTKLRMFFLCFRILSFPQGYGFGIPNKTEASGSNRDI
jgi:hypothetical protein